MEAGMTPFKWRDSDCLMVGALVAKRCTGCLFASTHDDECPHTDSEVPFICDSDNDFIFIDNTPEALVDYVSKKLEGT
jgi:hypothetical protein